jgi:aspartate aminotransferase
MEQPSARIQQLEESATIVMAQKSRELKAEGHEVIDLSLGEPDFTTPQHICESAKKAIDDGYHHYPPVPGYADLRQAISQNFKANNDLDYPPDQIVVSTGAKQTLANVMMSVLNDGDEVLVPIPYWVSYAAQIQLSGGKLVPLKTNIENDFKVTPQQVRSAMTGRSRLFLFSSPCNPTGTVYTRQELDAIAEVLSENPRMIVVSDEIYEHINFLGRHESIGTHGGLKDRVVTVNGVSKGFAMTGWRLGYMGAPKWIAKASAKIQGQFTSGANTIAQRAALAAITSD